MIKFITKIIIKARLEYSTTYIILYYILILDKTNFDDIFLIEDVDVGYIGIITLCRLLLYTSLDL